MPPTTGQRRTTAVPTDAIEPLGSVRRSQLVSSFGIGAIVDLEKGSFMPMGLEDWERVTNLPSLSIGEPRLQAMLRVSHFRLGPVKEDVPGTKLVRARSAAHPLSAFPNGMSVHVVTGSAKKAHRSSWLATVADSRASLMGFRSTPHRYDSCWPAEAAI